MTYIPWLISAGSLLVALLTFVRNGRKDDTAERTAQQQQIADIHESLLKANLKLDQLCSTTNETRTDVKAMQSSIIEHDKRLTLIERDLKTAFHLIDLLKGDDGK